LSGKLLRRVLAAVSLLALSGCVTPLEFQNLRKRVEGLEKGGHASDDWAKSGSSSSSSAAAPSSSRLADLDAEVTSLRDEVSKLQGEVDLLKKELAQVRGTPAGAAAPATPAEGAPVAGAPAPGAAPAPGTNSPVAAPNPSTEPPAPAASNASSEEVRDYEAAFGMYRAGKYADAIDRFQAFLQTHPSSEFADNALFWMGESYFKLNDFEQAAVAFDRVVKRFPNGNKVPDALYRQGVSLQEIGVRTGQQSTYGPAACQIFKRIADDYPSSERVAEARRQLEKCPS
jgi:tol-pal system protein YbgF